MQTENLIAVNEFCVHHHIEISFINLLQQNGLINITSMDETEFIEAQQLPQLEKYTRLYYDLDINLEGIETVTHLLQKIKVLQDEITTLRNRLRLYETNE